MSGGPGMALKPAKIAANSLMRELITSCTRIEIAGSIRRNKPLVHDIEIVCVPRIDRNVLFTPPGELFPRNMDLNLLEIRIDELKRADVLEMHPDDPKDGPRYKKLWSRAHQVQVDIFIVAPPAQWGPALAVRTGPAELSKAMVMALRRRGWRLEDLQVRDEQGLVRSCDTEERFFELCGTRYLEPWKRDQWASRLAHGGA